MKKIDGNDYLRRPGLSSQDLFPLRCPPSKVSFEAKKRFDLSFEELCAALDRLPEPQEKKSVVNNDSLNWKKSEGNPLDFEEEEDGLFYSDDDGFEEAEKLDSIVKQGKNSPAPTKASVPRQIETRKGEVKRTSVQISQKTSEVIKKCKEQLRKHEEVRMQEIEDYVIQNTVFRKINGSLCRWTGLCYRQLDLETFTSEMRNILPKEEERKISRFNRYKEAYNFMLANEKLENCFSDTAVMDAKSMIAFRNGLYSGKTGEWKKLSPEYPILFNIDAKYLGDREPETPHMDQIILFTTGGDRDVQELFYQVLGYIFSQGIDAKKFFVFATAPDSGKSIIGEFLGRILGDDNISVISMDDLGQRFSLGKIGTKALNYNMDLPAVELDRKSVQRIKQLTGDPRIDSEEKFVQNRTVVHHCKFLYASNHPIRTKEEDEAFYRRLVLIPFLYSVPDEDKDYQLLDKLWMERNAIATKAAHAYRRLCENNFVFHHSDLAEEMLSAWKGEEKQTLLYDFGREKCHFCPEDVGIFTPTEELFQTYQEYCFEKGRIIDDSEKSMFSRQFAKRFDVKKGKKRVAGYESPVNGYYGVMLSDPIQ